MALLAGSAITSIAGGIWQFLNSDKANTVNQRELDAIKELYNKIQDPNFDTSSIMPEEIQVLQRYVPETVPYVQEIAPEQVKAASAGAMAGRQAQMQALNKYKMLMEQGYDPQTAIEMARAQRAAGAESAASRQSAMQEGARRGFGGGPSFYQAGADQQGMDRLALSQQQALADAANRRTQATGAYAGLGGQIRGEDVGIEQANVNAINAFNARNAQSRQNWMQGQADTRNKGQMYNIGEQQRISEANKANRYNARTRQQDMINQQQQMGFNNQMARINGMSGAANAQMNQNLATTAQKNRAIQGGTDIVNKGLMYAYENENDAKDKYKPAKPAKYEKG